MFGPVVLAVWLMGAALVVGTQVLTRVAYACYYAVRCLLRSARSARHLTPGQRP